MIDDALNVFFRLLLASCKSSPSLVVVLVDGLPNDDDLDYVVATIFIDKTDAWREERETTTTRSLHDDPLLNCPVVKCAKCVSKCRILNLLSITKNERLLLRSQSASVP